MPTERELQIDPVVQESVIHNTKILSNVHSLTASLFGVGAGILGLESWSGFVFYALLSLLTTALIYALKVAPASRGLGDTSRYFGSTVGFWTSGLLDGLSGFVLTWTLVWGLVRA